jgi:hypothetical protein
LLPASSGQPSSSSQSTYFAGRERKPTAEFAPVKISVPPWYCLNRSFVLQVAQQPLERFLVRIVILSTG